MSRRPPSDRRLVNVAWASALALLAIAAAIPWPFLAHGRPLFRL
jgi:hypothetical protein